MFFKSKEHRIVIIGDRKVGKTCLLHAKLHNFYFESIPAIYAHLNTNIPLIINVDGKAIKMINWELVSWDSDPQTYLRYRPMIYGEGDVVLLCFDISNKESLFSLSEKVRQFNLVDTRYTRIWP